MDQITLVIGMAVAFTLGAVLSRGTPIVIGHKPKPVEEPKPIEASPELTAMEQLLKVETEKEEQRIKDLAKQMTNVMDFTIKVGKDRTHED